MFDVLFEQGGLLPALDRDAADAITGSNHILKAFADKHSLTAAAIVDLIKTDLKILNSIQTRLTLTCYSAFRVMDSGDLKVIYMHKDGNGPQILEFFT